MEAEYIERMVRAFIPWPIAWTVWDEKRIKLFDVDLVNCTHERGPGELFINDEDLLFATKERDVCIKVNSLQIAGKRKMNSQEFVNGFRKKLS